MPEWLSALRPHFPAILQWAAQDRNPEACADFFTDDIARSHYQSFPEILGQIDTPGFVDGLAGQVPSVAQHIGWFRAFLGRLTENMRTELEGWDEGDEGADDIEPEWSSGKSGNVDPGDKVGVRNPTRKEPGEPEG